jgi:hypothetical protein
MKKRPVFLCTVGWQLLSRSSFLCVFCDETKNLQSVVTLLLSVPITWFKNWFVKNRLNYNLVWIDALKCLISCVMNFINLEDDFKAWLHFWRSKRLTCKLLRSEIFRRGKSFWKKSQLVLHRMGLPSMLKWCN